MLNSRKDFIESDQRLCAKYALANLGKLHLSDANLPLRVPNASPA